MRSYLTIQQILLFALDEAFFWRMTKSMISWKESFSWVHIIFRQIVVSSESLKNKVNVVISYHSKSSTRRRFYQVPIFSYIWLVRTCRKITWTEILKNHRIDVYRPFFIVLTSENCWEEYFVSGSVIFAKNFQ